MVDDVKEPWNPYFESAHAILARPFHDLPTPYSTSSQPGKLTELRFLKPANWGGFGCFHEAHSRWHACCLHYADVKSGNSVVSPALPIIDDEHVPPLLEGSLHTADKIGQYVIGKTLGEGAFAKARGSPLLPFDF